MKKIDKYTFNSLWDAWTKSTYIEDHYPELVKKFKKGWIGDIAEFLVKNATKEQLDDIIYNSPYIGLEGTGKKRKPGKKRKTSKSRGCLAGGKVADMDNFGESEIRDGVYKFCKVGGKPTVTKKQIADVINGYWDTIQKAVKNGKNVQIYSVGSFRKIKKKYKDHLHGGGEKTTTKVKFSLSSVFEKEALGK